MLVGWDQLVRVLLFVAVLHAEEDIGGEVGVKGKELLPAGLHDCHVANLNSLYNSYIPFFVSVVLCVLLTHT